jgi:hypothetical protein
MSFLDALSGIGSGLGKGVETGQSIQANRLKLQQAKLQQAKLQQAKDEQAGAAAFGTTFGGVQQQQPQGILAHLQSLLGMGQQQPPAMPQGGPQAPAAPPGMSQAPMPQQAPQGPVNPAQMNAISQPRPQAPQPQAQPMAQPQQQPQAPQGQATWQQLAQQIKAKNPNISPMAMSYALDHALPFMNLQSQQEWKQAQLAISQQRADEAGVYHKDLVDQRASAAQTASDDRNARLKEQEGAASDKLAQQKVEQQSKEFERTSTAYEKLGAAIANDSKMDTPANQALLAKLQAKLATMAGVDPAQMPDVAKTKGSEQSWGDWFKSFVSSDTGKGAAPAASTDAGKPPMDGATKAPDGKWYVKDPKSPSGWSEVVQ